MSHKNPEYKPENRTYYGSFHDSPNENTFKTNHIVIDSDRKISEIKEENNNSEQNLIKINSNTDKTKISNSIHYEIDSNGNELRLTGNGLPPLKNKKSIEEGKFSNIHSKNDKATEKSLSKRINELKGEINKLRNDSNVQNYNILELNYKQKSKELTELKQENNFIRFQLEDLIRKNSKNINNIKNNNFVSSKENKKKSIGKMGNMRDYHIKLFSQKIKIEEDNKEKNLDDENKNIKNEECTKKIEELKKKIDI